MNKIFATLGAIGLLGGIAFGGLPTLHNDLSTGAYTVPVFDTISGDMEIGTFAVLEDGKTTWIHTKDYFGPLRKIDTTDGLTEVHLLSHKSYGTFQDTNSISYIKEVDAQTAASIFRGEQVETAAKVEFQGPLGASAAIANTASKTFAGKNLITSSTTAITITAGDTAFAYGGFNNTNTLNSMSLACTSGTVIKANAGVVITGAGNAHMWAIVNPTAGTDTCTITATTSAFFLVQESNYSGTLTTASALDAQNTGTCSATNTCTTSLTTITNNDWTVMFGANSVGTPGAGAGTTLRVTDANGVGLGDSNAPVSIGSNGLTFTQTGSLSFAQNIIALAPAIVAAVTVPMLQEF